MPRFDLIPKHDPANGDWPEDAGHENGHYFCRCCHCGREFIGHKRRVTCRLCANPTTGEGNG